MAATMLGQGKNVWQAEIDAACELIDFWRFNAKYAQELYESQPKHHSQGVWNRQEYCSLEGFILAISPFNFTAIGGNLVSAPCIMGNVAIWKPSPYAVYSNYLVCRILMEAGIPNGVIQFTPGDAILTTKTCFQHPDFAGLHFTGSTSVFKNLWKQIAMNLDTYKQYPRIVGETGGKNMHFVHSSADPQSVVFQTIRSAFEYQGQKCSACSRLYAPDNLWPEIQSGLLAEVKKITIGDVTEFKHFMNPVIHEQSFAKVKAYIDSAKQSNDVQILYGGECDDRMGYFIQPTILLTKDPYFKTMKEEIFGPILTIYVYPAKDYIKTMKLAESTTPYALTCSLFAKDRQAIVDGGHALRHAAGNFYINDKCTGAVVGQQPFGGSRASGTNDKAGASMNLLRWVSARSIKENFLPLKTFVYPSNI
ncbi:Delta-1-pyrroline-5-carboxylate dehydrogenase, mitochondrial [Coelomomyces lativittatus]|nr:Delta-1-pyrroline-5-carboxylate dehydrogenase, mitochondrial [Coelomomyces lativittatus]